EGLEAADRKILLRGAAVEEHEARLRHLVDAVPSVDRDHLIGALDRRAVHLDGEGHERGVAGERRGRGHAGTSARGGKRSCEPTVSARKPARPLARATCGYQALLP